MWRHLPKVLRDLYKGRKVVLGKGHVYQPTVQIGGTGKKVPVPTPKGLTSPAPEITRPRTVAEMATDEGTIFEETLAAQKRAAAQAKVAPGSRLPTTKGGEEVTRTGGGVARPTGAGSSPVLPQPRPRRLKTGELVDARGRPHPYDPAHATPMERLRQFPASGKYILDDPSVAAGIAGASVDWLAGTGLPSAMRAATRNIMGPGKRKAISFGRGGRSTPLQTEARMDTIIDDVWEQATRDEQLVALYDMRQAMYRASRDPSLQLGRKGDRGLGQGAWERLNAPQNERQMYVIHSTYIHANRIRAMQEMLEQWGHGGQRELHDISGMIYKRAQDLAQSLEKGSHAQFMQEFADFENMSKFISQFGTKTMGLMGAIAGGREMFGKNPPMPQDLV